MPGNIILDIAIAFGLKICDNALSTVKTIFLSKEKYVSAYLFASFSTLFYLLAIVRIANSNDPYSMAAMCVATFIGTLIPCFIVKKTEREKLYIFDVTSDTLENGKEFADALRKNNIAVNSNIVYNREMVKTLQCNIYCKTKEQSKVVNDLLKDKEDFKYNVCVPIE